MPPRDFLVPAPPRPRFLQREEILKKTKPCPVFPSSPGSSTAQNRGGHIPPARPGCLLHPSSSPWDERGRAVCPARGRGDSPGQCLRERGVPKLLCQLGVKPLHGMEKGTSTRTSPSHGRTWHPHAGELGAEKGQLVFGGCRLRMSAARDFPGAPGAGSGPRRPHLGCNEPHGALSQLPAPVAQAAPGRCRVRTNNNSLFTSRRHRPSHLPPELLAPPDPREEERETRRTPARLPAVPQAPSATHRAPGGCHRTPPTETPP